MKKFKSEWSRRRFIYTMSGAGAVLGMGPRSSWSFNQEDPRVASIVARTIGVDAHNHIDVPLNPANLPGPYVDLAGEMKKSGLSVICMTFAVDYQKLTAAGEAYERFTTGLNSMDGILKSNDMTRALNLADVKAAHKEQKPIVIQSVEGGHFLEGKLDRLGVAYGRGLRVLGMLHDSDASVPLGDVYTNPPTFGGLTPFGTEIIRESNRLGILLDLTHCSNETINAALKLSTHPVIISHTGLNTQLGQHPNMAKMMMPRLISKEQAKIVADSGGIIGIWTHLSDSPAEYAQNIRAMVEVVGINHVCIGTDTKMTPSYRPENGSQNNGGPNQARMGEKTNEAWADQKSGFYFAVVAALLKAGFNENEIGKIGGGNFCRVFDRATR